MDKETDVLNEVVIEGWFTGKAWHYAGDLFFRLSNYRDRQRPAKPQVEGREQPDYITIRILASGVPLALQKGALYRIHGYLQSREYKETLGDYVRRGNGLVHRERAQQIMTPCQKGAPDHTVRNEQLDLPYRVSYTLSTNHSQVSPNP